MWGTLWQASSTVRAPTDAAAPTIRSTGAIAPVTLDTWAKATSLVVSSTADRVAGSRRPLSSQSIHRRLAPVRAHSSCHGTRLAWCSARVVTIESPGPTRRRSVSGVLATLSPRPAETFDMT